MRYNDYSAWEFSKEKRAEAERMAERDRLAALVAGPDRTVPIAALVLLTIVVLMLFILI